MRDRAAESDPTSQSKPAKVSYPPQGGFLLSRFESVLVKRGYVDDIRGETVYSDASHCMSAYLFDTP